MKKGTTVILGLTVWAIAIYALVMTTYQVYRAFVPRSDVSVSLTLAFPEDTGFTISGNAYIDSKPATSGQAKLRIEREQPPAVITSIVIIDQGVFGTSKATLSALGDFSDGDSIIVNVDAEVPVEGHILRGHERASWSTVPSQQWFPWILVLVPALFVVFWILVFTGDVGIKKITSAVILSYLLAITFLIVPLLLPVWLADSPSLAARMATRPVGILRVHRISDDILLDQWVLNIGGIPTPVEISIETTSEERLKAPSNQNPATPPDPALPRSSPNSIVGAEGEPRNDASVGRAETTSLGGSPVYNVTSGLVVPLYVLIWATFGGAVSMTRRIPEYQQDIVQLRKAEKERRNLRKRLYSSPVEAFKLSVSGSGDESELQKLIDTYLEKSKPLGEVRRKLVDQCLFLITAPFLGILTFYLIFMVEEELAQRIPVVVLVTFASGLMSESILMKIRSFAETILGQKPSGEELEAGAAKSKAKLKAEQDAKDAAARPAAEAEAAVVRERGRIEAEQRAAAEQEGADDGVSDAPRGDR